MRWLSLGIKTEVMMMLNLPPIIDHQLAYPSNDPPVPLIHPARFTLSRFARDPPSPNYTFASSPSLVSSHWSRWLSRAIKTEQVKMLTLPP